MGLALEPAAAKDAATENFPVASRLLAPSARGPVLAFYRFVRLADDVADDPALAPAAKLARLDALEAALLRADPAEPAAARLAAVERERGAGLAEARAMLGAFRQDARQARYADWDGLMGYCDRSAAPAGRLLLRLHGEAGDAPTLRAADALCAALQVLNHLQDLGPDRERLGRVYLPLPWLERAGGEAAFFAAGAAARRRPVLDTALDLAEGLIAEAEALPGRVRSRRLAAQAAATLGCARLLARRLRAADPIDGRVEVGPREVAAAGLGALLGAASGARGGRPDARVTRDAVRSSGSSFARGIAALRGERRRAMDALYAFCRAADDAADGAAPPTERRRLLDDWRAELGAPRPRTPVGRELRRAAARFGLPEGEPRLLLDALGTDAEDRVRLADGAALAGYARGVAGAVGILSVRIFGAEGADAFALRLGHALQLVNVLRDVDEDADRDRLYLPLDRLAAHGLGDAAGRPAAEVAADPRFAAAWAELAGEAEAAFGAADAALRPLDPRPLRPALLMLWSYRPLLGRLRERGWRPRSPRVRLGRGDRLRLVWRALRTASAAAP